MVHLILINSKYSLKNIMMHVKKDGVKQLKEMKERMKNGLKLIVLSTKVLKEFQLNALLMEEK
jgi:hypothetical protein